MRRLLISLIFLAFFWFDAFSTGDSLYYVTAKDTIFLKVDPYGNKLFTHRMEAGQNLYSLARFYGLKINSLLTYNSHLDPELGFSPGTLINIPIPDTCILKNNDPSLEEQGYVPVRYVVKHGDTFYRIAKHFFKINLDTLQKWNNLESTMMFSGLQLHVGYFSTAGIPDTLQLANNSPLGAKMVSLQQEFEFKRSFEEPTFQNGAAYWQREKAGRSDLYCLHRYAPIGSVILVRNPMRNTSVYAKVIATIPDRAYGDDIVTVLSPTVAKILGARDPKFYVELSYFNKN